MFRCLDTGLDNSHQCLKKKKDMVRIDDNKISLQKGNSFETNLAQIKIGHGRNMN